MGRAAFIASPPAPRGGPRLRASGCRLWDFDGAERLDFDMAGAAAVLGHAHPAVETAVAAGQATAHDAAEALSTLLPRAPRVRFTAEEAQALPAAIDAARRATGRRRATVWEAGSGLFGGSGDVAAVVIDPLGVAPAALRQARADADACGAALIFDEGLSGFRVHDRGAQGLSGVIPDLAVFGAQIANGRALGAVAGNPDLIAALDDDDLAPPRAEAIAAATATLTVLAAAPVAGRICVLGAELQAEVVRLAEAGSAAAGFTLAGDPSLPTPLFGAPWLEGLWLREMAREGLNVIGPHALCAAHGEAEVARLIAAYARILPMMADEVRPRTPARQGLFVLPARPEGLA